MAVTAITDVGGVLKDLYPARKVEALVLKDHPFLGLLPKMTSFSGEHLQCPVIYSDGGGRSATFATAQAAAAVPANDAFMVVRAKDYGIFQIDGETLEAAQSNEGAFIQTLKMEVDGKMRAVAKSLSHKLFRDGSGSLGQVTGGITATDFVLNLEDVVNINVGDTLAATTGANSFAVLRAAGVNTMTVTAVDRATGTVTTGAVVTGLAANDHVVISGDRPLIAMVAHTQKLCVTGLLGWLNPTAGGLAATVAFFGVNRSVDSRLGGILDATAYGTVEEGLIELAGRVHAEGGRPDVAVINPKQFRILLKELEGKSQYNKAPAKSFAGGDSALVSYRAVVIDGPTGPISVVSDVDCQRGVGYMLTSETWQLASLGAAPKFLNADGVGNILRLGAADGYEGRVGYYGNLTCFAPGYNGYATNLPTI